LYEHLPQDEEGNTKVGKAVKLYDCARNVVHAQDDRLLVLQGLEDYIVVSTKDALLVCRKQDEQQIKRFVNDLTAEHGDRYV
jgi:mannose-1-phosphate guanylyltransferase